MTIKIGSILRTTGMGAYPDAIYNESATTG